MHRRYVTWTTISAFIRHLERALCMRAHPPAPVHDHLQALALAPAVAARLVMRHWRGQDSLAVTVRGAWRK